MMEQEGISISVMLNPLRRLHPEHQPVVEMEGVTVAYKTAGSEVVALDDISLEIGTGRFVAIVGPSGCGKSTLLHLIAGLISPTAGEVTLEGKRLQGMAKGIGYMFQNDGLLAWKTVAENVALPLRLQRLKPAEIKERVDDWLRRTGLLRFANAYPAQLSGGMRKRVALAQCLVHHPRLVLMDEPLSALDVQTRTLVGNELLALWARSRSTVVLVTHDLEEAIGLADEVVVMSARPSRVKAVYEVDLPRPRDLHDIRLTSSFQQLYARIWTDLREEVLLSHVHEA